VKSLSFLILTILTGLVSDGAGTLSWTFWHACRSLSNRQAWLRLDSAAPPAYTGPVHGAPFV